MTEAPATARQNAEEAFLDAAERLLVEIGYAAITTRRLAREAGANQGLVHYYFGSMENLLVRVLERFTERLIVRQRAMYAADLPFLEKWRQAMRYLDEDFASGYQKVWYELQAMAWNKPELRERIAHVTVEWREVLAGAFEQGRREHAIEMPIEPLATLVAAFNQGLILERLSGIDSGHRELLAWIDAWLEERER
ncbi:MAG TPA: helix-turn-helix domain-containing protein [Gaiellaceae bacterium]|nr:helix-turn-helix domain-containing protein [Gaiellaceae bacterium]